MRKIVYWVHTSVDGFIDGPDGEFDWAVLGPELAAYSERLSGRADTLLFGRPVWAMMVGFWPTAEQVAPDDAHAAVYAPYWRATPKVVVSRTFTGDDWTAEVINEDLAGRIAELKGRPGADILLVGGSNLAAALTEAGLIDEYHIAVHPVVLGGGRRLFGAPAERVNLRLVAVRPADGRVVVQHYEPVR